MKKKTTAQVLLTSAPYVNVIPKIMQQLLFERTTEPEIRHDTYILRNHFIL